MTIEMRKEKADQTKAQGNEEFKKGKYELAISFYQIAWKHYESSILYSNIARCHLVNSENFPEEMVKSHLDRCIESWAQALSLDSENIKAIIIMGDCSIKMAHNQLNPLFLEEAIQYYQYDSFINFLARPSKSARTRKSL